MKHSFSNLRRIALVLGVAAGAMAVPAHARDGEGYAGVDLGITFPRDTKIDVRGDNNIVVNNKKGWDLDAVVGYDWGAIRTELEIGQKRWKHDSVDITTQGALNTGGALVAGSYGNPHGKDRLTTVMANALLDFGGNGGVGFYVGVGAGRAWQTTRVGAPAAAPLFLHDKDSAWAWQGIAGIRVPVGQSVELGLKYKYVNTHPFHMVDAFGRPARFDTQTHSLMASLLFNFGGGAPPPPPPPPPPQTKTCPDGSTVDINADCPVPPPPPVAPTGERG